MLTSRRRAVGGSFVAAAVMIMVASTVVMMNGRARATSTSIKGNFTSLQVTGTDCSSPVGFCTAGSLSGGLKGAFEFTGSSLITSVDTPTTSVVFYTGDISIQTKDGDLICKDAGAFRTAGDGAVSSVCTIGGGTADLAGATGTIQFVGTLVAGVGTGDYRGTLLVP